MSNWFFTANGLHTDVFVRNRLAMPISINGICVETPVNASTFPIALGSSVPISRGSPPHAAIHKRLRR